jgi:3-isopropylmalate dehydrogenase
LGWEVAVPANRSTRRLGVLHGEGIGPEIIGGALEVLSAVAGASGVHVEVEVGPECGGADAGHLTPAEEAFCRRLFEKDVPLLCGPRGGRFVYDLRERFDLYCKLSPVRPLESLADAGVLRPASRAADLLFVRENVGGLYFGSHRERRANGVLEQADHAFGYRRAEVLRILDVAVRLALSRRGRLAVAIKTGGVPSISALWRECAEEACAGLPIRVELLEIDNACYQVVADAPRFDVVVSPNMFGDVLADVAALLLGSRALSYSANFGEAGPAVYQTGHGAASDLAGSDGANPVGQILSLASLLEHGLGLADMAESVRDACDAVLAEGWRSDDLMADGCRRVGTRELSKRIADRAYALAAGIGS